MGFNQGLEAARLNNISAQIIHPDTLAVTGNFKDVVSNCHKLISSYGVGSRSKTGLMQELGYLRC